LAYVSGSYLNNVRIENAGRLQSGTVEAVLVEGTVGQLYVENALFINGRGGGISLQCSGPGIYRNVSFINNQGTGVTSYGSSLTLSDATWFIGCTFDGNYQALRLYNVLDFALQDSRIVNHLWYYYSPAVEIACQSYSYFNHSGGVISNNYFGT
jgi:hypothetical protein